MPRHRCIWLVNVMSYDLCIKVHTGTLGQTQPAAHHKKRRSAVHQKLCYTPDQRHPEAQLTSPWAKNAFSPRVGLQPG